MDAVREYLLGVTAAAILCGVVTGLLGKQGMLGTTVKMLTGIFMALTVVGPLVDLRIDSLRDITTNIAADADEVAASGENSARGAMAEIIKSQAEAYILDKAASLDAELTVEVTLDDGSPPAPCGVRLSGDVSPYAKKMLSEMMAQDLGISTEAQTWS